VAFNQGGPDKQQGLLDTTGYFSPVFYSAAANPTECEGKKMENVEYFDLYVFEHPRASETFRLYFTAIGEETLYQGHFLKQKAVGKQQVEGMRKFIENKQNCKCPLVTIVIKKLCCQQTFEFCDAAVDEYRYGIKNNVLPKEYKKEDEGVCCPPRGWFKSMCSWLGGR